MRLPFSVVLPKTANSVNADMMSVSQIHEKLEKGYADIEMGQYNRIADEILTLDTFPERFRIMESEPEKSM